MDAWEIARVADEVAELMTPESASSILQAIGGELGGAAAIRHAVRTHAPEAAQPLLNSLLNEPDASAETVAAAVATAVVTASRVESQLGRTDIVWTGPNTVPVSSHRPTAAVAHELIASAKEHLTLATYSAGKVDDLIQALDRRRRDGVDIRLILETPKSDGSGPDCPRVFERLVPYVNALHWPRASRQDHDWTSMHIKVLIRDADAVLITSANMSRAAMRDNMELGVKIQGGSIPGRLRKHFDDLQEMGILDAVSSSGADRPGLADHRQCR